MENSLRRPSLSILVALLLVVLASLITALVHPLVGLAVMLAAVAVFYVLQTGYKVFWYYLIFILLGYLFLGKGFAYIGVNGIYVSEIGLALAVLSAALLTPGQQRLPARPLRPEIAILLLVMLWGAVCTLPYLSTYGQFALRDAVIWGYALFALTIYYLVPDAAISMFVRLYSRLAPIILVWALLGMIIFRSGLLSFSFPGTSVPILHMKSGDVAVHLAGVGSFILLRLDKCSKQRSAGAIWVLWTLWSAAWLVHATINRGGMLSSLMGLLVVFLLRPRTRWDRLVVIGLIAVSVLLLTDITVTIPGTARVLSTEQLIANFQSVFSETSSSLLDGTRRWRLMWWEKIVDYTLNGEYFWTGKGYGINLADSDGFQVNSDGSLRSPHNLYMTFLARSGVPGLLLWLAFIGILLVRLWRVARQSHDREDADYAVWFLAYITAFLVNATFDVFIEGPMGGIWFWSLTGLALAYFLKERELPVRNEHPSHP